MDENSVAARISFTKLQTIFITFAWLHVNFGQVEIWGDPCPGLQMQVIEGYCGEEEKWKINHLLYGGRSCTLRNALDVATLNQWE